MSSTKGFINSILGWQEKSSEYTITINHHVPYLHLGQDMLSGFNEFIYLIEENIVVR
jgi:hypothetical protein